MSRSGYVFDLENWQMIMWRGQVASATRGKRGQELFKDLVDSLESMTNKSLITTELSAPDGEVCALGAVGIKRAIAMEDIDPEDSERVALIFNIAEPLAKEIAFMNDEYFDRETPEERHTKMLAWAKSCLVVKPECL